MQQAAFRKNKSLEETAKRDWENYVKILQDDPNSVLNYQATSDSRIKDSRDNSKNAHDEEFVRSICCQLNQDQQYQHLHQSLRSMEERETTRVREGSEWLLEIRQKLVPAMLASHAIRERAKLEADTTTTTIASSADMPNASLKEQHKQIRQYSAAIRSKTKLTSKERQTHAAAELKANMERGTQTQSMFDDELALLGYARQKFHQRAMLAFSSLDRLDPSYRIPTSNDEDETVNGNLELMQEIWGRLLSIQQIISIGCGPGCDAVGVLGFLQSHGVNVANGILLMDFVLDAWKESVLNTLVPIISPEFVPFVRMVPCNVKEPLSSQQQPNGETSSSANQQALLELTRSSERDHRIIVVSYLLTETRGTWKAFFEHLLGLLQGTQSLLLLTEPTAWQLREFLKYFGQARGSQNDLLVKAHVWLDSSRDLPHLQDLDSRNGPAILLVCTN